MKKFITTIVLFLIISFLVAEIVARLFKLSPDVPTRFVDSDSGIHLYESGQDGYYTRFNNSWEVNKYGWLGTFNDEKKPLISIIGDSYIENIMNPIECNQGSFLEQSIQDFGFFEAGRAGVSFIEAMEITKLLKKQVDPKFHLIYINQKDVLESLRAYGYRPSVVQLDLEKKELFFVELKGSRLKKILYSSKCLYFLYLKFKSNKNLKADPNNNLDHKYEPLVIKKLFEFCIEKYGNKNIAFVFHPNTSNIIIERARNAGYPSLELSSPNSTDWKLKDGHWSCVGHEAFSKQVALFIRQEIEDNF